MPREPRVIMEGVCYHVITHGHEGREIFKNKTDYEKYLYLLKRYKKKFKFKLYGWCLMKTHPHLIMESSLLSKIMHAVNMCYAQYYRKKYGSKGYVWEDRFKSYIIQKDEYLINCITYIEYNPVKAGVVLKPEDYKWSSYSARVLGKKDFLFLLDNIQGM